MRLYLDREGWIGMVIAQIGRCREVGIVVNRSKSGTGRGEEERRGRKGMGNGPRLSSRVSAGTQSPAYEKLCNRKVASKQDQRKNRDKYLT